MTVSIPAYDMIIDKRGLPKLVVASRKKIVLGGLREPRQLADMFRKRCGLGNFAEEHFSQQLWTRKAN